MTLHVIHFIQRIEEEPCKALMKACLDAIADGASEIHIRMSSTGGFNNPGFCLANFLKSLQIPVTAHNLGTVESIAIPVYLAAATRTAEPTSRFVAHPMIWTVASAMEIPHHTLREWVASLNNDLDRYVLAFEEATQGAQQTFDIRTALAGNSPTVLDVSDALRAKVVHRVTSAPLPASSVVVRWVDA